MKNEEDGTDVLHSSFFNMSDPIRNIKLVLEYDGTDFLGWQIQKHGRTVQGVLQEALKTLLREDLRVVGAGRTDAGVHALGQVANLHTTRKLPLEALVRGLNALLPADVVVRQADSVPADFHARFTAVGRIYRYRLAMHQTALQRRYTWWVPYPLDLDALQAAAALLVGEHDFCSFCVAASARVSGGICRVGQVSWTERGEELHFTIQADRFLHQMVRTLVGTMLKVGRNKWTVADFGHILALRDRCRAGPTAPPQGLTLMKVLYRDASL